MTSAQKEQIVHESETQRQHVRLQFPAFAYIGGGRYPVKNLSPGGVCLEGYSKSHASGESLDVRLVLPFEEFSLDVDLKSKVQYFEENDSELGLRFVDQTPRQISVLNHVLHAFIAGEVVSSGELLSVVARENFVKLRKQGPKANTDPAADIREHWKSYAFFGGLAVVLLAFIGMNLFEKVFVLKTSNGVVKSQVVVMRSPVDGVFSPILPEDVRSVRISQPLGTVRSAESLPESIENRVENLAVQGGIPGDPTDRISKGRAITLESPCECYIEHQHAGSGEYVPLGAPLLSLVPIDSRPWIEATVPIADVYKLEIGDDVNLKILGAQGAIRGKVVDVQSNLGPRSVEFADTTMPVGIVRMEPVEQLSPDLVGRPVLVEFLLY